MVLAITKDKQLKKKCPWQVQALKKNNTVALIHFDKVLQEKKKLFETTSGRNKNLSLRLQGKVFETTLNMQLFPFVGRHFLMLAY